MLNKNIKLALVEAPTNVFGAVIYKSKLYSLIKFFLHTHWIKHTMYFRQTTFSAVPK
jgi:hypothetical protein